ncbi:MAG TPA: hypothetical protein VGL77_08555, partial [Armatimonadota bacterium]
MATWLSGTSKQHRTIRQNAFVWCGIYLAIFGLVILRMFWLQVVQGHTYRKIADRYHMRDTVLPATRGRLLDRNLTVLASDDQARSLFADPTLVESPEFVADQLAPIIGRTAEDISAELLHQVPSVMVADDLPQDTANAVEALKLPGLQVVAEDTQYRVQLDPAQLPSDAAVVKRLAGALGVRATVIVPPPAPTPGQPAPPAPPARHRSHRRSAPPPALPIGEKRWLKGYFSTEVKEAVAKLQVTGVSFEQVPQQFTVEVDPRIYNADRPRMTANDAASLLAPVLKLPPELVEGRLLFRPR